MPLAQLAVQPLYAVRGFHANVVAQRLATALIDLHDVRGFGQVRVTLHQARIQIFGKVVDGKSAAIALDR
jgi:hypothetical protein